MPARHAVLLTPSIAAGVFRHSCGAEHTFRTTNPLPAAHYCFKSFNCNTYGSPRKCCKQKTYGLTKPFRCNTYKKQGGGCRLLISQFYRQRRRPAYKSGVQLAAGLTFQLPPEKILKIAHLVPEQIQLPRQALNFRFRAPVDGVIKLAAHAIFPVLAVLAHHNDRRLNGRKQGQNKIQQDKRIRIPGRLVQAYVDRCVDAAQNEKTNDEAPGSAELDHRVRDALGKRRFRFDHFVRIAHRADSHELLRGVKLPPQHGQHIHSRMRLALQQRRNVASADFHALCFLHGRRAGLVSRLFQHRGESKERAVTRLIHNDLLLVFVYRRDSDFSGDHHVGLSARIAHLVDALPRSEILELHLPRQHRRFLFVEQRKQRNVLQHFGIAGHRPPLPREPDWFSVFQAFESSATGNNRAHSKPDEWRGFKKHSAKLGKALRSKTRRARTISSLDYSDFHVLSRRILPQQRRHSLRPALESLRSAKRNNHRENLFRRARHHRSFRITGGTAVRSGGIAKNRQAFQVQIVFADALVGFARAPCAENNFTGHMRQVIQSNRQAAFHRDEIDYVHDGINLRQSFSSDHAPQQRFRRTAVPRRIFSQRFVRLARRFHLRRFQHAAWERQFLNFVLSFFHFFEQGHRRRACFHARRHAPERGPRALLLQPGINFHFHFGCGPAIPDVLRHGAFYNQEAKSGQGAKNFIAFLPANQDFRELPGIIAPRVAGSTDDRMRWSRGGPQSFKTLNVGNQQLQVF